MRQLFCQEHWDELVPEIRSEDINGIGLQPLAMQALWAHDDVKEEFDHIIGEHENDAELVVREVGPICCWLEGRTAYSEDSDFEDDYQILIECARGDLDEQPEEFWMN